MEPQLPATPPPDPADDWGSPLHVRALVLIGLTAAGLYACAAMLAPFLAPLAWALALAVLFVPMHRALETHLRRPNIAALLLLWGAIVVGGIDNLLYPLLVGGRLKLHSAVALVSIIGSLLVFGAPGLILGPVVFTITRGLRRIRSRRNAEADAADLA